MDHDQQRFGKAGPGLALAFGTVPSVRTERYSYCPRHMADDKT
jgi:hypothetical protein